MSGIRPRRRTPRRREAPRWVPVDWERATLALLKRDGGRCGWCGKPLGGQGVRHHRQKRTVGGDRLSNVVILHPNCHNVAAGSVHQEPALAVARGFIVPTWVDDLSTAPLQTDQSVWWTLDDSGRRHAHDPRTVT